MEPAAPLCLFELWRVRIEIELSDLGELGFRANARILIDSVSRFIRLDLL